MDTVTTKKQDEQHLPDKKPSVEVELTADQAKTIKTQMKGKITDYKLTVTQGLIVFHDMLQNDARKSVRMEPGFATKMKEKLVDVAVEKAWEVGGDLLGIGEKLASHAAVAFETVRDGVESQVKQEEAMNALDVLQAVTESTSAALETFVARANDIIEALSDERIAGVAKVLSAFSTVSDDDDGKQTGSLKHGLENWALERIGLPRSGGAIIHELAVGYYSQYRVSLMQTKPVREQVDEMKEMQGGSLTLESNEKAKESEKRLHIDKGIEKDQIERERVSQV